MRGPPRNDATHGAHRLEHAVAVSQATAGAEHGVDVVVDRRIAHEYARSRRIRQRRIRHAPAPSALSRPRALARVSSSSRWRIGVGDDAGAGAETQGVAFDFGAADQDVEVEVAVAVQPAESAGVGAATDAFQLGDDLHAAHLRAAGDRATRKHRADHAAGRDLGAQVAAHVADDVVHVRIALDRHQFVDLDAARRADATEVVAFEIDQHHVLGAFLGMGDELGRITRVLHRRRPVKRGRVPAMGRVSTIWRPLHRRAGVRVRS